jgi:hypothetical protein
VGGVVVVGYENLEEVILENVPMLTLHHTYKHMI